MTDLQAPADASEVPSARAREAHEKVLAAYGRRFAEFKVRRKLLAAERNDLIRAAVDAGLSHSQAAEVGHVYKANVGFIVARPGRAVAFDPERLDRVGAAVKMIDLERQALLPERNAAVVDAVRRYRMHYERVASLIGQTRANVGYIVTANGAATTP